MRLALRFHPGAVKKIIIIKTPPKLGLETLVNAPI
jgi:hypothetical protein